MGKHLYRQKRDEEFAAYLDWLGEVLAIEKIDALLVAGDVFDNTTPSAAAQTMYYRFLAKAAAGGCSNIIIIAGNHDSASFLNAPRLVLKELNVFVIGAADKENPEKEIIVLNDVSGAPIAIVCAVPFLRERDIRMSDAGETSQDKDRRMVEAIHGHYAVVCEAAEKKRKTLEKRDGRRIPLIATGHLFASGGKTVEDDGVRELYVGALGRVGGDVFPPFLDYVALGHLHIPQTVGGSGRIRYSGSPIPMSFAEAGNEKSVVLVNFAKSAEPETTALPVPMFQRLEKLKGNLSELLAEINELKVENSEIWLEIEYAGDEMPADLKGDLDDAVEDSKLRILRVINRKIMERALSRENADETLEDLSEEDVFQKLLDSREAPEEQRPMLEELYAEVLFKLRNPNDETAAPKPIVNW